jgi:antitoxin component YwqK of YwqJK toxin-antitoxin module
MKRINWSETVRRDGLIYHQDTNELVTGTVEWFHERDVSIQVSLKGQLGSRGNYIDGKREGLWEWFYENGQLWSRENFKDGKLDGLYESFYDNGQLRIRGNFIDGEPDGLLEYFDEEGNLTRTMTPANDREPIEL